MAEQRIPQGQQPVRTARGHVARCAAAVAFAAVLASSATGCSAISGIANSITHASSAATASMGQVVAAGQPVKTMDGDYDTIALPAGSPVYTSTAKPAQGVSKEDFEASRKFVADYMVTQYLDSTALETGAAGAKGWIDGTAPQWIDPGTLQSLAQKGPQGIVLGTLKPMPALIHDGKPREKDASISFENTDPVNANFGRTAVEYRVTFVADYRVSDHAAAAFAANRFTDTKMTADQFIASKYAKDQLKDGKGENVYKVTGDADITVAKTSSGGWQIIAFRTNTNDDIRDFAQSPS